MRSRSYLLWVLLLVLATNGIERVAFGLLLQQIKIDLGLTDTQIGLLTGIAFAFFYSVMGIPLARWADRGNRVTLIALTTSLWSTAVALCAVAGSFLQLLLVRIGIAVGEAGCVPPAHSLIADHFDRADRPRAAAFYMMGIPLGSVVGYFLAGWLNELYGWRATFVLLGLPGLALAALVRLTLREPRQLAPARSVPVELVPSPPGLREVFSTLWTQRAFRHLLFCVVVGTFFATGVWQWQPAFLIRTYGLGTGELGTWLAVIYGLGGFLGTWLGGEMSSRYAPRNERRQLQALAAVYVLMSLVWVGIYTSTQLHAAFILLAIGAVANGMANGPLFATIQTLVPANMRAVSVALIFFLANLVGMGLGPLSAGLLSDGLRPWAGDDSLRFALLLLCPGLLWCAWHVWRASTTVAEELAMVEDAHER